MAGTKAGSAGNYTATAYPMSRLMGHFGHDMFYPYVILGIRCERVVMSNVSIPHPLRRQLQGCSLYLVGMMASGKSSTGRLLAQRLGYGFVDTDSVVEQMAGSSIPEIFEQIGESGFRSLETQALGAISQYHSLVVATGGGAVTRPDNWGILRQGIVIWLDLNRDQLLVRLDADEVQRPLLQVADSLAVLDTLLEARRPLYNEADLQVTVGAESLSEVVEQIFNLLRSQLKNPGNLTVPQTIAG